MRITTENPVHGARVFCNGIEFGIRENGFAVLVADEEEGRVEAVRFRHRELLQHDSLTPLTRYFTGKVKVLLPDEDARDLALSRAALAESPERIPWADVKQRLGIN